MRKIHFLLILLLLSGLAKAQDTSPSVVFVSTGEIECADLVNRKLNVDVVFEFTNYPTTIFNLVLTYGLQGGSSQKSNYQTNYSSDFDPYDETTGILTKTISYEYPNNFPDEIHSFSVYFCNPTVSLVTTSASGEREEYVTNDTIWYTVYGYPTAEIVSGDKFCGLETELIANTQWDDVSTYEWTVSSGELIDGNKSTALVKTDGPATIDVTLTEYAGGECASDPVSKTVELLGSPSGILDYDDNPTNEPIVVCTSNNEKKPFGAIITLDGYEPFSIVTSDNQSFTGLEKGEASVELIANKADVITLANITDVNGCEALEEDMTGSVTVIDRRPNAKVTKDTVTYNMTKDIKLEGIPSDEEHDIYWDLSEKYADYPVKFRSHSDNPTAVTTTMSGLHEFYFIEIDYGEENVACRDTATLVINVEAEAKAPDGFSPNGDGKNDNLVIDGLVPNNLVMIFDSHGKKIYEKTNYRNDWDASDVADGYYLLVAKGDGMKTRKETIVVKRSK